MLPHWKIGRPTKAEMLSHHITHAYQDNKISWFDYDEWMEEVRIASSEGSCE